MAYVTRTGDPISLADEKAGALRMSVDLADFGSASTSAIDMFARRDAYRTVAEAIADGMATVPFDVYERDDDNGRRKLAGFEHPVAAALEEPVPGMSLYRWVEALVLDDVLHDRWAVLVLREDDGSVQLVRLPGKWISFGVDALRRIVSVELNRPGTKPYSIPISECIFDVGYDPNPSGDSTKGYAVSRTLETAATELDAGANYRAKLLAGGPKVPMYVSRPADAPKWDDNGAKRFKEDFAGYSTDKAGKVPLLEDGMELKAAPQLLQDTVQYRETRLAAQVEFAIAMHYPPELIGYREGNFSNIAALREQLYVDVLGGRIIAFRQALNIGLYRTKLLDRSRFYVEENVGIRLMGNPELQAKILQTQTGAPIRSVNESRRMLNLPPVDGGDELIVPLNVTRGGLASPTDTGPKTLGRFRRTLALPAGDGAKAAGIEASVDTMVDRFARDLERTLRAQAARITKALGDGNAPGSLADAFDTAREDAELAATILPHAYAIAQAGAETVLAAYNPDSDGFDPEKMLPWLAKATQGEASSINAGTFATLAAKVAQPEWADAVTAALERTATAGSRLWAQTIATVSRSFGAHDAARLSGLTHKTWKSRGADSRHADIDGETVPIDQLFSNGLRWPGDPTGTSGETASCHCHAEYSATR